MITRALRILLPMVIALLAASCTRQAGPHVLEREQFVALYVKLARAGVSVREAGADTSAAHRRAEEILRDAGVAPADLQATTRWYNEDVSRWRGFYEDVLAAMGDTLRR